MAREAARVAQRCETARDNGHLDLSSCELTMIPDGVLMLTRGGETIQTADLSNNFLKAVSTRFPVKLAQLKEVNVSHNEIQNLPNSFGGLIELQKLNLSNNDFSSIPDVVYSLSELQVLKIHQNKINNIDIDRLKELKNLQELSIEGNPLPEDIINRLKECQFHTY